MKFIGLVVLVFFLVVSCGEPREEKLLDVNVVLITLDTLRADFVGAYNQGKADTPAIDAVAAEGVLFERCIAQTPLTLPSHTSLLSGTYPLHHQIRDNGGFLVPQELEMISESLQKQGFETSAFIASYVLHSRWGFNQGFDTYSDDFDLSQYESISLGNVQKSAEVVLNNATNWFKLRQADNVRKTKPFFTWIHLYDPHTPYDPPSPYKEKYPRNPYRGEVEYMDHQLELFFDFLKKEGLYQRCLIILTADHGESLGQHGERTHGFFIYQPTVWVPLIIRAPRPFPVKKVRNIVELIDIAPTIMDALGFPLPEAYQGQSMLGLMKGDKERTKNTAYSETYYPRFHFGWSELKALFYDDHMKYIIAPRPEMFDLSTDLPETDNLALKKSYQAGVVKKLFQRFIAEKSKNARKPGENKKLARDDLKKLAALGYITSVVDTSGKMDLPDPKDKVRVFSNLSRAKDLMAAKEYDQAIELLKKVITDEPGLTDGFLQLGILYSKKNMQEQALAQYYKVLAQKPDYNAAMINVLNTLIRLGQYDRGIVAARGFLTTFPDDHGILNELASLYILKKDYAAARKVLLQSIAVEKINPRAYNKLTGIYLAQGEIARAAESIKKVTNLRLREVNYHLARLEEEAGKTQQAIEYYKKELASFPDHYQSAYNLAELLRKSGHLDEALTYYLRTIECNPQFNIAYFMAAKYYLDRRSRLDEVERLCLIGVRLQPPDKYTAFGYYILADLFSAKGDLKLSSRYYQQAQSIKEALVRAHRW